MKRLNEMIIIAQMGNEAETFSVEALIFVLIITVYIITSHLLQKIKMSFLHESTIAILLGFITAIFVKFALDKQISFSNQLFFSLMLPPIIFSAGFSIPKTPFFQNFGKIAFLGIVGSLIQFILLTLLLHLINYHLFTFLTSLDILLLCSVLTSTDSTIVTAIVKADKYPTLNAMMSGESILNSAVAIILFGTISKVQTDDSEIGSNIMISLVLKFLYLFFFSLVLGLAFGFSLSYLFKKVYSFTRFPLKEISLIILMGYFSYLVGELLGVSGIITLFTCSIVFGHYGYCNLSEESKKGTGLAFETVRYISEAFIFAYLGASLLGVNGRWSAVGIGFVIICILPLLRFIITYILPLFYKLVRRPFPLTSKEVKVLCYSGIIRGAVAFALSLQVRSEEAKFIISVVLVIVMTTTFLQATFLKTFLKKINLSNQFQLMYSEQRVNAIIELVEKNADVLPASKYDSIGHELSDDNTQKKSTSFRDFEQKFIRPIFIRKNSVSSASEMQENIMANKKIEVQ